ncbi:MAG: hypothetical protein M3Y59_19845 [Myxococcota bacterium]|nr:hypothetical protein [Myxococcota bacterium]
MTRRLLSALLLLTFANCDHRIGTEPLPQGRTAVATGLTAELRGVFAVSDSEVYVVGSGGTVALFDGADLEPFQIQGVSEQDVLWDVAAADTGEVVVIGGTPQETPLTVTLHSGAWTTLAALDPPAAIHGQKLMSTLHMGFELSKRVVLAGGRQAGGYFEGVAQSYSGGQFTPMDLYSQYSLLTDVTAIGATLYFRHDQGVLAIDSGRTDLPSVPTEVNTNVVALSEGRVKFMFGFAGDGTFHTMTDGVWSEVETGITTVTAIDGRSVNDLYAVGGFGGFHHYDGTAWTALESGTTEHLRDLHVLPTGHVYVVGTNGTFFVYVP